MPLHLLHWLETFSKLGDKRRMEQCLLAPIKANSQLDQPTVRWLSEIQKPSQDQQGPQSTTPDLWAANTYCHIPRRIHGCLRRSPIIVSHRLIHCCYTHLRHRFKKSVIFEAYTAWLIPDIFDLRRWRRWLYLSDPWLCYLRNKIIKPRQLHDHFYLCVIWLIDFRVDGLFWMYL